MICKTCLIPDTRPDTEFVDGRCSACISYENRPAIDWAARKDELVKLLDRFHGRVLVPSSGGKDSTSQVINLLKMGADVTIVTARTCMLTDLGRRNIDNLSLYAPTIEVVPNMTDRAELNRMGLDLLGDISWPEHMAIFSTPFRVAVSERIPLIMYGENPQNQYGGPPGTTEARQMTRRWTQEFGGFLGMRPSDVTGMDMRAYTLPPDSEIEKLGVEAHFLGQYLPWDSHANAELAIDHGMLALGVPPSRANWWPFENLDNAQTGIHDYFMWLKYGFGRAEAQLSVDMRSGRISRTYALKQIPRQDERYPSKYMEYALGEILDHIGMKYERFQQLCDQFQGEKCSQLG